MTSAEQTYAAALASAIVASLRERRANGPLVRVTIRWFEGPDYLTIHALGAEDEQEVDPDDAWYPLEWPNLDDEIGRVDGVMQDAAVRDAVSSLADELDATEGWPWDVQPPPIVAAAATVRSLVVEAGLPVAEHFAVSVSHFEGWGAAESVPRANPAAVVQRLSELGLEPVD